MPSRKETSNIASRDVRRFESFCARSGDAAEAAQSMIPKRPKRPAKAKRNVAGSVLI